MSTLPENELDLEKLFLPAWAQEPPSVKRYAHYEGGEELRERRGERRERRPPRREGEPGGRPRDTRPRDDRRGPRREGDRKRPFGEQRRPTGDREPRESRGRERREPPPPLPEVNVSLLPEEKGVESLARQIRMTGRAFPLFDIARLILERPERYAVAFAIRSNAEGQPVQPLFLCALDDTLWLSEDEAVAHVLKRHFATFYQTERTAAEPPKGKYTFVAQCGMSGVILGPPNHHDYQNQLRKLHTERFSRMPFDVFKARVKIVRDEEVVKQWIDGQSWKTEFVCLNMPEPLRLPNLEAVEKHFREVHKENILKPVESHQLGGVAARSLRSPELVRLVRHVWEEQRRFPLQLATILSQQFAGLGLQFFKVKRTFTHVSVARPHFLDLETTPVSEGVKRIVEFINADPKCTRRKLVEALAPSPAPATILVPPTETEAAQSPAPSPEPTAEQTAVIADLHWLIHQGHVIEFANGILETAKKPLPKPPKAEPKPTEQAAEAVPAAEGITGPPEATADVASAEVSGEAAEAPPVMASSEISSDVAEAPPALEAAPAADPSAPIEDAPVPEPQHPAT